MWKTSDFLGVQRDDREYLFFLVADEYWLRSADGREVSEVLEEVFARDIGEQAAVVLSFFEDRERNQKHILEKEWPEDAKHLLDAGGEPLLLVIAQDFVRFDPAHDQYAFIRLSGDARDVVNQLRQLASHVRKGDQLFALLEKRSSQASRVWGRVVESVELKPGAFGFAIDLKQLFAPE